MNAEVSLLPSKIRRAKTSRIRRAKIGRALVVSLALAIWLVLALGCTSSSGAPLVPHPITQELCVDCHRTGKGGAPVQKHPNRGSCLNCHRPVR